MVIINKNHAFSLHRNKQKIAHQEIFFLLDCLVQNVIINIYFTDSKHLFRHVFANFSKKKFYTITNVKSGKFQFLYSLCSTEICSVNNVVVILQWLKHLLVTTAVTCRFWVHISVYVTSVCRAGCRGISPGTSVSSPPRSPTQCEITAR